MFEFCKGLYDFSLAELEKNRTFADIEMELGSRIYKAGYEPTTTQIHMYNMVTVIPTDSPPQPRDFITVHPNVSNGDYAVGVEFGRTVRIMKDGSVERLQRTPAKLNLVSILGVMFWVKLEVRLASISIFQET